MIGARRAAILSSRSYASKVLSIQRANLLAYWKLAEPSGTTILDSSGNARTGTYTGVTLGQTGIGDGGTAPLFGGSDYGNVYSTSLRDAFVGGEFTVALWLRVQSSGVWGDGTNRRALTLQADASNLVQIIKGASVLTCSYTAGGTAKSVTSAAQSSTGWLHVALTGSKSGDALKAYLSGAQISTTQTGLGTWAGTLAATTTVIGAVSTVPANAFSGYLAHVAVWSTPLTAAQIATLSVVR